MRTVTTGDGVALHVEEWGAAGPGRGTVVVVHGSGEQSGRYQHVAEALDADRWL